MSAPRTWSSAPTRRQLLALGAAVACGAGPAVATERLRITGTGSGTGGVRLVAQAFMARHKGTAIEVLPALGSKGGIRALADGRLDIAVSNRPPRPAEQAVAPMQSVRYARTPFLLAVHRDLGVRALRMAELVALYRDAPAQFPNGARARPVLRLSDATDSLLIKAFGPELPAALDAAAERRGMLDAATDTECADLIERTPGAFGPSTLALIESERRPLVPLVLDGVAPSVDNLVVGRWTHHKELLLVLPAQPAPLALRFVAFLQGPDGRRLLSAHGHAVV